ncbi:hypothetical protein C5F64_13785 [Photobacterium damselae subsp. damselae]|uniref:hypothetical protein n=1 Tax=Photobacterium damselae TaxID=38293 RepID=UPI000D085EE9|nr:hypothetical protein [Photobacterium damselae]PSB84112.1 hypothetical protein C5F64_13785 [Photobacterium damselae subsp. damselae]
MTNTQSCIKIFGASTGCISLDIALGGKSSLEFSSMTEVSGENGVGKTTLALHSVVNCQRTGGVAAFIETEQAIDPTYMERVGINMTDVIFSQPKSMDEAFKIAFELVKSDTVNLIIFDSIASMLPQNEINNGLECKNAALEFSRELGKNLEQLQSLVKNSMCSIIFINQLRQNPNNSEWYSIGGKPIERYMNTRIRLKKGKLLLSKKDNETKIGHHVIATVTKNDYGLKGNIATFSIHHQKGINTILDAFNKAMEYGLIQETQQGFIVGYKPLQGEVIGRTKADVLNVLATYPDFRTELDTASLYEHLRRQKKLLK